MMGHSEGCRVPWCGQGWGIISLRSMKVIEAHVTPGFGRKMGHLGMEGPQVAPPQTLHPGKHYS